MPISQHARRCDSASSDDGPIFSTVAKLVEALKRSIPEGTQNAELKNEALHLPSELLRWNEVRGGVTTEPQEVRIASSYVRQRQQVLHSCLNARLF